jgi:hypothetical protein
MDLIADVMKGLKLDAWYKALLYIGGVVLVVSFFLDAKGITNAHLQLVSGGLFLVGLGEWKNHKVEKEFVPPNAYLGGRALLVTRTIRSPDPLGCVFDIIGIFLLGAGILGIILAFLSPTSTPSPTPTPLP